jgi:hypothetical protein
VALEPSAWLTLLREKHSTDLPDLQKWSRYYAGEQPLSYMDPELVRELGHRIRPVVLNWPRLVVDSLEERLDVEGFRFAGDTDASKLLWEWWQANDLDEQSSQGHIDALVQRRAFVIVGSGDSKGDAPVITVESAEQVTASFDPRTRSVRAALKAWKDEEAGGEYATLYLPDATHFYGTDERNQWVELDRDEHRLGVVPVVPLVNRALTMKPEGVSELADVVPISDAACKVATDMMIAAEFHAMPRRWVVGMGADEFTDAQGRPLSEWSRIAGRVWAHEDEAVKMGQFPEADLSNFHSTINALARLVASMAGLPVDFLGLATENPPSAEARRAGLERLVKRAERRQRAFGGSWERVMRTALLVAGEDVDATGLETIWRDASTPTVAQKADAAVKLHAEGIVPTRQVREDLGYTQAQIDRMETLDDAEAEAMTRRDVAALPPVE